MIDSIIRFSLQHKWFVLCGVILIIFGGVYSSHKMDIDVFPDLTAPTVVVLTDCSGMASEEVEKLVTFPIETAVNGASHVRRVRSSSSYGASFVWIEFDWGTDVFKARQVISEKLVTVSGKLPTGISPQLAPQSSIMGEILFVGLQANDSISRTLPHPTNQMELRSLADWVVKPAILATGGVSQVTVIGGDNKQYQVLADPMLLHAHQVSLQELTDAVAGMQHNAEGAVIREFGNEYALRYIGRTEDITQMSKTLIKMSPSGSPITIGDVATITVGSAQKTGYASLNAHPAVLLSISKQPNVNTLEVTRQIEERLENIKRSLPDDVTMDTHIFRQGDFIEASVSNVRNALLEGAVLVVLILFLFLGSFRTTLISVTAIPLSLLGTLIVLYWMGLDINTMTLGGMCIAIGSLVDDAIIDVENVYKRLRENHVKKEAERLPVMRIVFEASSEIRSSVLGATLIVIIAFVPMFFLSGMEGRMLKPLGIAYLVSLVMSLLVAMTVTPLFCSRILTGSQYLKRQEKEKFTSRFLKNHYRKGLQWALSHSRLVVLPIGCLFVAALLSMFTLGSSFLPDFNEGSLTISAVSKPGISLEESQKIGNHLERSLLKIPEVKSTARRTGRGELDEHSQTSHSAEIDVNFHPSNRSKEEILKDVRYQLASVPGVVTSVGQPLGHRIDHILSGTRASIAIKLFGNDLGVMQLLGQRIQQTIKDVPGLVDLNMEQLSETPQLALKPIPDAMNRYGVTQQDISRTVTMGFGGEKMGEVYEGQRSYDLIVRFPHYYTQSAEGVKKSLVDSKTGTMVPLEEVCKVESSFGPGTITRENVRRKLVISANVSGRDVGSVVKDIRKAIDHNITLPQDYNIEYGGQFENAQRASRTLFIATLMAIIVIYLLLFSEFRQFSLAALVMAGLPMALIGGVAGLILSSQSLSIPAIIGFITLFGMAARGGILLVSRYLTLQHDNHMSLDEAIINGSSDRLNPILMTAMTSALALIPLVAGGDQAGNEIQRPMAIVVLGGLISSTLLLLFVVPVLYRWQADRKNKKQTSPLHAMKPTILTLLAAVFFCTIPTKAQSPAIQQILKKVETQSTRLLSARQHADARKNEVRQDNTLPPLEAGVGLLSGTHHEGKRYDVSLSQSFEFPSVYIHQKKLIRQQQQQADILYLNERQNLLLDAYCECLNVIGCNLMEKHLSSDLQESRRMATAVCALYQKGEVTELDKRHALRDTVYYHSEWMRVKTMKATHLERLKLLCGNEPVTLSDTLFPTHILPQQFDTWLKTQCTSHPMIQWAEGNVREQELLFKTAKARALPGIGLGVMSEKTAEEHYQGVTVNLQIPLWGSRHRIQTARKYQEAASSEMKAVREEILNALRSRFQEALTLQNAACSYRNTLEANPTDALLKKSLESGQINMVTYLQEKQRGHEMYEKMIELERDFAIAVANLQATELFSTSR